MPPPAPNGFNGKLGGVVIDPHTDPATILRGIIHPIGTNLTKLLVRKIVGTYAFRLPLGLVVPSAIGKRAHEFLLFRINRNDRLPRTLKHFHTAVDRAKLGITIGMRRPPLTSCACPVSYSPSLPTTAPRWYG